VHLWDIAALRDIVRLAALVAALGIAFAHAELTLPVLAALVLGGVFHPLVTHAHQRWGWPRALGAGISLVCVTGAVAVVLAVGVPRMGQAVYNFAADIPRYVSAMPQSVSGPVQNAVDGLQGAAPSSLSEVVAWYRQAQGIVGVAASVTGTVVYALVIFVFCSALFVYWLAHLDRIDRIQRYLPRRWREPAWGLLSQFAQVLVGFVRGQLVVAAFTTTGFAVGFSVLGVPHALVPALVGGTLSFIPNGQASGWLLAMLLTGLDQIQGSGFDWLSVFLWPTCVYAVTQSLEAFVVTPWVQGSYTRLHPLAVLGALLAGAVMGGFLGVLIAIPAAACLKLVMLRIWGSDEAAPPPGRILSRSPR
jgi:predicted PurR-regulated permease PerM